MPSGDMPVRVVDIDGRPIAGAQVTGTVDINFGPLPSTCCNAVTLGEDVTDRNGVAVLRRPALTFHPAAIYVRAPGSSEVTTFPFTPSFFAPVMPDAGARLPMARTVLDAEGRIPIVVQATAAGATPPSR